MADCKNIYKKLSEIQSELKAPKNQRNSFGKYNYRSCEDILEALKPLLLKANCALVLCDYPELVGDWHYIRAAATIYDSESGEKISNSAYARESAVKKGMDDSQITGTASSYARKYALNGLFCIDDTKDADTDGYAQQIASNAIAHNVPAYQAPQPQTSHICIQCKNPIVDAPTKDGKMIPAEVIYKHYGGICAQCAKANAEAKNNNSEKVGN